MKFDVVHAGRQGKIFSDPPGLPEVGMSRSIAAIGIASLIALFVLAFVDLALTAPALAGPLRVAAVAQSGGMS